MRIAVISDTHGNIHALRAVLYGAQSHGVDTFIFAGDMVTDLCFANEVYDTIRALDATVYAIRGNRERGLLGEALPFCSQIAALNITRDTLSAENRRYIENLPDALQINLCGTDLYLHHRPDELVGSDAAARVHIFASSTDTHDSFNRKISAALDGCADIDALPAGIHICGHLHTQWIYEKGDVLFLNPGSCGLATDNEVDAEWMLLTNDGGCWNAQHMRSEYDRRAALDALRNSPAYPHAAVWLELVALSIEQGIESLQLFFAHMDRNYRAHRLDNGLYPDWLWDTAGHRWVTQYRHKHNLPPLA